MKKRVYQLTTFIVLTAFVLVGPTVLNMSNSSMINLFACESVEECDTQSEELAQKRRKLEKELKETKRQQDNLYEEMALLMDSVKVLDEELVTLRAGIDKLVGEIKELKVLIVTKENDVKKLLQQQQKETNNNIYLSMLLSAHSISDFMIKMNAVETINSARQQYIVGLQNDKDKLETSKTKLDEKKDEVEEKKRQQEAIIEESKETLKKLAVLAAQTEDKIGDIEMSQDEINRQRAVIGGGVPSANGWYLPAASGWLTCPINCYSDHIGNDFGMRMGTDVYAIANGTVVYTQWSTATTGYGTMITIAHMIDGVPHISIYGHLSALGVQVGDVVRGGQRIGLSGNTGASTAPHLHLEIVRNTNVFVGKTFRRAKANLVDALLVLPRPSFDWRW